jgi:hypothetical protein
VRIFKTLRQVSAMNMRAGLRAKVICFSCLVCLFRRCCVYVVTLKSRIRCTQQKEPFPQPAAPVHEPMTGIKLTHINFNHALADSKRLLQRYTICYSPSSCRHDVAFARFLRTQEMLSESSMMIFYFSVFSLILSFEGL